MSQKTSARMESRGSARPFPGHASEYEGAVLRIIALDLNGEAPVFGVQVARMLHSQGGGRGGGF